MKNNLQDRIGYYGDISEHLKKVCDDFSLGTYLSCEIKQWGYVDFNLKMATSTGNYFVKYFYAGRTLESCKRVVEISERLLSAGVTFPKLHKNKNGQSLQVDNFEGAILKFIVQDFIEGRNLFETNEKLTDDETRELINEVVKINTLNYQPEFDYDSWAITSFPAEFESKKDKIDSEDRKILEPLVEQYENIDIDSLPKSLVHGDIIATNVMKDYDGKIWIIDVECVNWQPRIVELAVLFCNIFFNEDKVENQRVYELVLEEYQKTILLTDEELKLLPLFIKFAHAMHVLNAGYEKATGNISEENEYWLNLGRKGLE